jgi:hypothetical protein
MWDAHKQSKAQEDFERAVAGFAAAIEAWRNALQTGNTTQATIAEAAVEEVLRNWRQEITILRERVQGAGTSEHDSIDQLSQRVQDLTEQRALLANLQSQQVTRDEQATSVNPKTVPSPYTNVLGLQRTFRNSVRQGIIIAAIVFGLVALGVLGYVIYAMVVIPAADRTAYGAGPIGGMSGGGGDWAAKKRS